MITVAEAEHIIQSHLGNYGDELVPFEQALGRVLAEAITADRDLPPCNKVTMDGIAFRFATFDAGTRSFKVLGTVAAGERPIEIAGDNECVEIMTGCAMPESADTVIRYEDIEIKDSVATIHTQDVRKGQNIHIKGKDRKQGDMVVAAGQYVDATVISMAASVGKEMLLVKKLPHVVVISTGDELVEVSAIPTPYQTRRSNNYTIRAVLSSYRIGVDMMHIADNASETKEKLQRCLERYDVIILSGGVSMGKFDYVPQALDELHVEQLFHKVRQRPGKPFWFGCHANGAKVFAFPGNPVSTFMCLHRYFVPWLESSLYQISNSGLNSNQHKTLMWYAALDSDITFAPQLQYFAQVKLQMNHQGMLVATPVEGHGSGDFANLLDTDAFMELPLEQSIFKKGEVYRIWPFKKIMA